LILIRFLKKLLGRYSHLAQKEARKEEEEEIGSRRRS